MNEYPALIYRNQKNNVYMANCITKNLSGYGKTEEEALDNLKNTMQVFFGADDISFKKMYGILA